MLDDELLLKSAEGVDYSSLPSMPTPEDFYLLSRVKGETSVAQLCAASGWGKEKAKQTIEKLIEFGLLVPNEVDSEGGGADPGATAEGPAVEAVEAVKADPGATLEGEAITAERPTDATQSASREEEATPVSQRDRALTPAQTTHSESSSNGRQTPNRDQVRTPVRDERRSSFNIPVVEEEEDDLFMSDSPAHLSRVRGVSKLPRESVANDASSTRPFEDGEDFVSSLEAETNASDDAAPSGQDAENGGEEASASAGEASEPGFAILESEAAEESFGAGTDDDPTRMIDPTSLDIATSVASVDSERTRTNRGGGAVDGPLAFAMLPGNLSDFTVDPELLDPALEIDPRARQEVAYVHEHLGSVNHYELFGVSPEANRKEIKKAYFVLSKRFHPDLYFRKNVGPFGKMVEDVFKTVTNAYRVLSHRKKRAQYDDELRESAAMAADAANAQARAESGVDEELEQKRQLARELLIKRGTTHEVKGEFVRAADCFRKAISIRSEPELFVKLGNALYRANKRLDDAAKYCRAALKQEPENIDAMLVLAKILERNEVYAEALDLLLKAKELAPGEASIGVHEDRIRSLMGDG